MEDPGGGPGDRVEGPGDVRGEWVGGWGGGEASLPGEVRGVQGETGGRRNQRWEGGETQRDGSERGHPPSEAVSRDHCWGRPGRGAGAGVPCAGLGAPLTAQPPGRAWRCRAVFTAGGSRHPYLYLGPAPWGQGCLSSALLENPLREGARGGGWIAQPLGHVVGRAGPGAGWIWGSPQLGTGVTLRGGGEELDLEDPKWGPWSVKWEGVKAGGRVPEENPAPMRMRTLRWKHRGCVTQRGVPWVVGSGSPRAGAAPGLEETGQHLEGQLPQGGCAGQSGAVGRGVGAQRCPLRLRGD